jgi:hypothetical protein
MAGVVEGKIARPSVHFDLSGVNDAVGLLFE